MSARHPVDPWIMAAGVYSWESQVRQYPVHGNPGIGYFAGETPHGTVDCLLYRDGTGLVRGILNHYPQDMPRERKGNVNIWVDPDWQRRGIATELVREARRRWDISFTGQRFSEAGAALADKLDPPPRKRGIQP